MILCQNNTCFCDIQLFRKRQIDTTHTRMPPKSILQSTTLTIPYPIHATDAAILNKSETREPLLYANTVLQDFGIIGSLL